jgi:ribosomal protein S18 acetylase RimI-like enzyme
MLNQLFIENIMMTSQPIDLSHTAIPQQIQENMVAYLRMFAGLPGITIHDADTFWIVSHQPAPGNVVLQTRWTAEDADKNLDNLFEQIGQHVDQMDWMLFPNDQPADLGQRLEERGMPGGPAGNWLWADLKLLKPFPPMPDNFHIEQVVNDQLTAEWVKVSAAGFGSELDGYFEAYARHGYGKDAYSLHYIGYLDEVPVTSGTLLDAGGCASIYDISTPPEFRAQGFGGAMTHFLMQQIAMRGYPDTWIWSSNMAKSVYQKLGYIDADFGVREHKWHKSG